MRLRFTNHRAPSALDELSPAEQSQLAAAGVLWDTVDLTAAQRLSNDPAYAEHSFLGFVHIWDVLDDDEGGRLAYRYFAYCTDSGTFFVGESVGYDAEVIQFQLHVPDRGALRTALSEARERQRDELRAHRSLFDL